MAGIPADASPMIPQVRAEKRRQVWVSTAVVAGLLGAMSFVSGLSSVYLYWKRGFCPALMGWWSVGAPMFRLALLLSVVFWVSLVLTTRRFRGLALFGAGLALGLWLWFGATSAIHEGERQRAYRLEQGVPAAAPLPDWAWSTDREACPGGK